MRRAILFVVLVLPLASAVGCGEYDSNELSARAVDGAISKLEYIARSNALCERTGRKADGAFKRIVGHIDKCAGDQ